MKVKAVGRHPPRDRRILRVVEELKSGFSADFPLMVRGICRVTPQLVSNLLKGLETFAEVERLTAWLTAELSNLIERRV